MKGYLNLKNGTRQDFHVNINEKLMGNTKAVYIEAFSNEIIDPDFGAAVELEINNVQAWMADFRYSEYWCKPSFGTELYDVPDETQGLICKKNDGSYCVILPVVSERYKCVLCGWEDGKLIAKLFSWSDKLTACKALVCMIAEGDNPYELLAECTKNVLYLLGHGCRTREERRYPEIFEYLGWCSWDAFEIRVSEKKLLSKCREFKEKNIPVKWAIIDDMWAEVRDFYNIPYKNREEMFRLMHSSKLYSFRADPVRFPGGLKECIEKINAEGIRVGMWHPTTGYWMGIDPEGEIYRDYKDCLIEAENGAIVPDWKQEKTYRLYNAFHNYLRSCGAEFVKIDNQTMARRFYKGRTTIGEAARNFHNGMEASVGQHFDNQMINCMGMGSEDMWNRTVSPVSRCSDDFLPENREWFTKHILQCSYNSLIQGQFYYCDWDMWWTDDGQAVKNSILRAVSGGPIYVSDTYGRSCREVLMPLVLENGKILRCDRPAMPARDSLVCDPVSDGKVFKLQNICGDSGVVAVFNLDEKERKVSGVVSPSDIEGIKGDEFAVYEHFSKELKILKRDEGLEIVLDNADEFRLYIVVPLKDGFAPIGRIDKFISPKTVRFVDGNRIYLEEPGTYAYVKDYKLVIEDEH